MAIKKKIEIIILLLILVLAAFLRLYRIADYMTFLGDEGRDALVVKRIIVDHKLTLLGPTASVGGFFLGPIYYYFMIPFLWMFRLNPVGPAVMVALFGIATVFLVYKVGKDFFNWKEGLIAAWFYAISPLVIYYSRTSWNPNILPFFSLLIIWLSWRTTKEKKLLFLPLIGFLFGIAIQLHYLTVFLMVVISVYFLIYLRKFNYLKYYFGAILGFILGWSPFLLFELRHNFPNFKTLYRFIFFAEETGFIAKNFLPIISNVALRVFSSLVTNGKKFLAWFFLLSSIFSLIFYWIKEKKEEGKDEVYSLLSLWLFFGVTLFGFYQKPIYDYYFGFMFPLPFLLSALVISKIAQIKKGFFWLSSAFIFLLSVTNFQKFPFRYPPNRQLAETEKIAKFVLEKTEGEPFNFALITGQNSDHAYRYFFEILGNSPLTIKNFQVDPERKTVTDQLFVICESLPCQPLGHPLWEIAGFGQAEIVGEWDVSVVKIYKLGHYPPNNEKK